MVSLMIILWFVVALSASIVLGAAISEISDRNESELRVNEHYGGNRAAG